MNNNLIRVFKTTIFNDKVIKIGLINNKLSYIGLEKESIYDFYKSYTVRNVLKSDDFTKYIEMLKNFENHKAYNLNFDDLYLPNLTTRQIKILEKITLLDYGQYMSFTDFAKLLKTDQIGLITKVVSKNPILLLIPCHRLTSRSLEIRHRCGNKFKSFLIKNNY